MTRHWINVQCPFCYWTKSFSPESKPSAIRRACREIAEHFIGHRVSNGALVSFRGPADLGKQPDDLTRAGP